MSQATLEMVALSVPPNRTTPALALNLYSVGTDRWMWHASGLVTEQMRLIQNAGGVMLENYPQLKAKKVVEGTLGNAIERMPLKGSTTSFTYTLNGATVTVTKADTVNDMPVYVMPLTTWGERALNTQLLQQNLSALSAVHDITVGEGTIKFLPGLLDIDNLTALFGRCVEFMQRST